MVGQSGARLFDASAGDGLAPVVTVVTICRDAATTIEATMLSVLGQTYGDLEYIIVDGASIDSTVEIVERISTAFPDRIVTVVSEPDQGISDAMNKGVERSEGDLVVHLHAGDRFTGTDVIEKVVDSYRRIGWRWAVATSIAVDDHGVQQRVYEPHADFRTLLRKNVIPHQSTFLVRDVFTKHGLFRVDLPQGMDYEFWMRIAFRGAERYEVLPLTTTYYLVGGASSRIGELLWHVARIRRELRRDGVRLSRASDARFLGRIALFWTWNEARDRCRQLGRRSRPSL